MTDRLKEAAKLVVEKWNTEALVDMQVYINKLEDALRPSREEIADWFDNFHNGDISFHPSVAEQREWTGYAIEELRK